MSVARLRAGWSAAALRRAVASAAGAAALLGTVAVAPARAAPPPPAREADERLAYWLERQGFDRLLTVLLEERLVRDAAEIDRRDAAERLRDVIRRRLREGELAPEAAAGLAEKVRPLLPTVDAEELLLDVLRSRQRAAESRLDRLRLGLAADGEAAAIAAELEAISGELDRLRRRIEISMRGDDRKLDRSVGLEAEALLDDLDRRRALLETSRFAQAWTLLNTALLAKSSAAPSRDRRGRDDAWRGPATAAREHFDALLDTGVADPTPDDVGVDRRGDEMYASALLGAAMARLLVDGPAKADPWFGLLEDARTASLPRRSAPGWKLIMLALVRDFPAARTWLETLAARGPVPPSWLRAVVIECRDPEVLAQPGASELVQAVLAVMASQEALGEVIALAEGLPARALPSEGFLAGYLRGISQYAAARAMPATEAEETRREAFRTAAGTLRGAAAGRDAERSPLGAGSALQLAGWSLVGAGDFEEASAAFEQASELLPPGRAAESLWLAAEAAGRATRLAGAGAGTGAMSETRRRLIERLMERFPDSEYALRAEVLRIRHDPKAGAEALARLRAVPRGSPAWVEALVAAEEILYRGIRTATRRGIDGDLERRRAAAEYLEVVRQDDAPDPATLRTWLRRRAEVALLPGVDRVDDAEAAVATLRARAAAGEIAIDDLEPELRLRDLQIAAVSGRLETATALLRVFESEGDAAATEPFVRAGRRALLRGAQRIDSDAARTIVVDVGVGMADAEWGALEESARRALALAAGQAAARLAERSAGDATHREGGTPAVASDERLRAALELLDRALSMRPSDAALLETTSRLAERLGDDERALACLRAILAGAAIGEPTWFDARVRQVRVLARSHPALARRVLDQHRVLIPEWGPEPWGSELRELDRRVPSMPSGAPGGNAPGAGSGA